MNCLSGKIRISSIFGKLRIYGIAVSLPFFPGSNFCEGQYFTTMDTLMRKLKESQSKRKAYLTSSLVVVDEVGYLPVDSKEAYLFFQFVSYRYEKNSTIITSNKSFGDWQELFGDPVIATAILDRLLHHCKVVNIKGHSYRLKEHTTVKEQLNRKEDTLQPQES